VVRGSVGTRVVRGSAGTRVVRGSAGTRVVRGCVGACVVVRRIFTLKVVHDRSSNVQTELWVF